MSSTAKIDPETRDKLLTRPDVILDDPDLMRALVSATEAARGDNIVDMRGMAMQRLESRLDRLENLHRSVIAAAYDSISGTNQIHRAVLKLLDPDTFEGFVTGLGSDVAQILRVEAIHLVLESAQGDEAATLGRLGDVLRVMGPGFVQTYISRGDTGRQVVLRQLRHAGADIYGAKAGRVRSEACMVLDLGTGRAPALLVIGSGDAKQFSPQQGTDLLAFFAGVFERTMRQWLKRA
ncbi:DUF484 family protein [Chachezhania sediminis]|uniref:DUF484 family protein n=1 Tax=Chachezhania sediminis TaxID=2599291 RepID=UPI00131AB262|nr:DUF484 family protein [Chachezhania sediminis]